MAPRKLSGSIQFQDITPEPIEIPNVISHNKAIKNPLLFESLIFNYIFSTCYWGNKLNYHNNPPYMFLVYFRFYPF